jgi:hypothetical protein
MVRRLSVANLDSGAESPVYGEEPSASADRGPVVNPPRADGDGRRAVGGGRTVAGCYLAPGVVVGGRGRAVGADGITSLQVPQCLATRDITMTVSFVTPGLVGTGMPRHATSCDMSVVDQQSGRWYAKGHPCIYAADGNPMTWFTSSWAVPYGPRSPRKLTDVHGREG